MPSLTPPAWLPKESADIYKTIVKMMEESQILQPTDTYAIALLADGLYTYQACVQQIAAEGNLIKGDRGQSVRHPAHTIKSTTFTSINALFIQLGLTPSARKKLEIEASQIASENSTDVLAQFIA